MDATTIGIDLAKEVFEVAMANDRWRVIKRERLGALLGAHRAAARASGDVVAESVCAALCPTAKDRSDRRGGHARGGAEWRHSAGGREDGDAAGRAGAASDARPMDDDANGTAQRHARPAA